MTEVKLQISGETVHSSELAWTKRHLHKMWIEEMENLSYPFIFGSLEPQCCFICYLTYSVSGTSQMCGLNCVPQNIR